MCGGSFFGLTGGIPKPAKVESSTELSNIPARFRIYVSRKDIEAARLGDGTAPIAYALKRKFNLNELPGTHSSRRQVRIGREEFEWSPNGEGLNAYNFEHTNKPMHVRLKRI